MTFIYDLLIYMDYPLLRNSLSDQLNHRIKVQERSLEYSKQYFSFKRNAYMQEVSKKFVYGFSLINTEM